MQAPIFLYNLEAQEQSSAALQNLSAWGHIFGDPNVAADNGIVAYGDAAEDGAVAIYDDVVFENGVAIDAFDGASLLVEGEALGTEGDALVELHVVAQDAGGTDDDTRTVVNGEVTTDGGGGVYVDTGLAMGHLGDNARNEGYAQQMQFVGHAVITDGTYGRIAADDLTIACCGRVALVGCNHIGGKQAAQMGEATDELGGDAFGLATGTFALLGKAEAGLDLFYKFIVKTLHIDARVVGKGVVKVLKMEYPQANIVAVDYDPGASEVNQLNRIKLMLSSAQKNIEKNP